MFPARSQKGRTRFRVRRSFAETALRASRSDPASARTLHILHNLTQIKSYPALTYTLGASAGLNPMTTYSIELNDETGAICEVRTRVFALDDHAIDHAGRIDHPHEMKVWQGDRLVAHFRPLGPLATWSASASHNNG